MKLYYSPGACSLADHIVLEWIGKPYEAVRVSRDERRSPEFLELNPAGAVPVLQDGDWVLTQNAAILNYLADSSPEADLGGDGTPKGRAEVNRWLAFVNSDMHPTFKPLFGSIAWLEDDAAIDKGKAVARKSLRGMFERVDAQLAGNDWIAGTRSIADPYLYVVTRWAKGNDVYLSGLANLARFFARIESDAAVQRVLETEAGAGHG
jgi:glutathione S-transferase